MAKKSPLAILNKKDNIAVVVQETLKAGDEIRVGSKKIKAQSNIHFGHKVAIREIPEGEFVIKYGEKIGKARVNIKEGEHVHIHNVEDVVDELRMRALEERGISID